MQPTSYVYTMPETLTCEVCSLSFIFDSRNMRKNRKYCSRDCYKIKMREKFDSVAYPVIWYNGKREYLHRVIYMEYHGVKLTPEQIVHHIDENPFNRDISNLELLEGDARAIHLARHDYHRNKKKKAPVDYEDIPF